MYLAVGAPKGFLKTPALPTVGKGEAAKLLLGEPWGAGQVPGLWGRPRTPLPDSYMWTTREPFPGRDLTLYCSREL